MAKIKPQFVNHSDQYGPVATQADGSSFTISDGEWFQRANAPQLHEGETVIGAAWSPQMGVMLTSSEGRVLTHDLGNVSEWREAV